MSLNAQTAPQEELEVLQDFLEIYECAVDAEAGLRDSKECEDLMNKFLTKYPIEEPVSFSFNPF